MERFTYNFCRLIYGDPSRQQKWFKENLIEYRLTSLIFTSPWQSNVDCIFFFLHNKGLSASQVTLVKHINSGKAYKGYLCEYVKENTL